MGPSSLKPDAMKVDPRTLTTVLMQYTRAKHAIDLANATFYSVSLGGAISRGKDLDERAAQLMRACSIAGGRDLEPVSAGGRAEGGDPGAAASAADLQPGPPAASTSFPSSSSAAPRPSPIAHFISRQEALVRAAALSPLGLDGGFSPVVRVAVPFGRETPHPLSLCSVCCFNPDDPAYKVSLISDGCVLGQLPGAARASRCGEPSIRTFVDNAHERSKAEALSGVPPPPEAPCLDDCALQYRCIQGQPSLPGGPGPSSIQTVISAACLHGIPALNGTIAGYLHENYRYYYRIFADFARALPLDVEAFYLDIICQLWKPFLQRFPLDLVPEMKRAVPPFHAQGHNERCKALYGAFAQPGLGRECTEHEEQWREIRLRVGHLLKYMSTDRFIDLLQLCMFQIASEKRVDIFNLLVTRQARMMKLDATFSDRKAQLLSEVVSSLHRAPAGAGAGAGAGLGAGAGVASSCDSQADAGGVHVVKAIATLDELAAELTARDVAKRLPQVAADPSNLERWCLAVLVHDVAKGAERSAAADALFGHDRSQIAVQKAKAELAKLNGLVILELSSRRIAGSTDPSRTWLVATLLELKRDAAFVQLASGAVKQKMLGIEFTIQRFSCEYSFLHSQLQKDTLTSEEVII